MLNDAGRSLNGDGIRRGVVDLRLGSVDHLCDTAELEDREARPEADLLDTIARLHVE